MPPDVLNFMGVPDQPLQFYQFQLLKETGRVHGFFIDLVFHVVWFDPHRRLYA